MATSRDATATVVADPALDEDLMAAKERRRAAAWAMIDQLRQRNADKDPDEEIAFITAVVEEVRQERHEREQQEPTAGRG